METTIKLNLPKWNVEALTGYKPVTTFWEDFSIAEKFGVNAIMDTYKRTFNAWKENYIYLTELVMVLNHKMWVWYENNDNLSTTYGELWEVADNYACENLKNKELEYFYVTTD